MKPVIITALALLLPCAASAQVFKCVDESGKVAFSDQGCSAGHTSSTISVTPANSLDSSQYRNQPPAYLQPEAAPKQNGTRVTVVGDSGRQESAQRKLCREASTPHKGSHGLTAAQRVHAAKICHGIDLPMPETRAYAAPGAPVQGPAAPAQITNCDNAGCWDTNGVRYNRGAGATHFPATGGPACQFINDKMFCP